MTTGEKIKYLRKGNCYTQDDLANYLGCRKEAIYKYEKGIVTNIPLEKIERMAELFHVSPCWLAGWEESPEEHEIDQPPKQIETKTAPSKEDEAILNQYHQLNDEGKAKVVTYAKDLVDGGNFSIYSQDAERQKNA